MAEHRKILTEGPRERRKEDRRIADEKTSQIRRKLSDRRTTYDTDEGLNDRSLYSNRLGQKFDDDTDPFLREDREIFRRNGNVKWRRDFGRHDKATKPFISLIRPKIKSKKGGLIGLGFILGNAFNAGMKAYEEKQ